MQRLSMNNQHSTGYKNTVPPCQNCFCQSSKANQKSNDSQVLEYPALSIATNGSYKEPVDENFYYTLDNDVNNDRNSTSDYSNDSYIEYYKQHEKVDNCFTC